MSDASPAKPAPEAAAAGPKGGGVSGVGAVALGLFIIIGGGLVFGFASSLWPAIAAQGEAACRPLDPLKREGPAPTWTLQDLQGNTVRLEDFRGKFLVINFWATWCEPCIGEWPQVDRLAERLADRDDVVVLAISIDKAREDIPPFLERMSLSGTQVKVLWDPEQAINKAYGSEKIPDTFFVGRDGELLQAYVNVRDWGKPAAFRCVASMAD
ncbi:MAG: TlpA family protein disulfide reductase [Myxococcales bacterium]|nr:TlpA family protein disulfide reductase [Myxococcales bacterium]